MSGVKKRNAGAELLRIIAMLMIVFSHFFYHGTLEIKHTGTNGLFSEMFGGFGNIGVALFILISGFFSVNSISLNKERIIKLICQTTFYSIVTYFIASFCGIQVFRIKSIITSGLPFISGASGYWFIPCYLLLILTTPFLNSALHNTQEKTLRNTILIYIFTWCLMRPIFYSLFKTHEYTLVSNIGWFVLVYCIGGYLRLYPLKINNNKKSLSKWLVSAISIYVLFCTINYYKLFPSDGLIGKTLNSLTELFGEIGRNSFMTIMIAIPMFLLFLKLNVPGQKLWTKIGTSTLGVYLLHDSNWLRNYLWQEVIPVARWFSNWYFFIYAIIFSLLIFIIGIIADLLRKYLLERPLFNNNIFRKIIGLDYKER